MNYSFRKLHHDDIASVLSMFQDIKEENIDMSFANITEPHEIENFIDNPAELTYVAVENEASNNVLCLVKGKRNLSPEKDHAVFLTAATQKNARGGGLVGKLVDYSLKEMKKEGVSIARIYVYSDNTPSVNAVKKMDFEPSGAVLRHHKNVESGEYVDDLIFHKLL